MDEKRMERRQVVEDQLNLRKRIEAIVDAFKFEYSNDREEYIELARNKRFYDAITNDLTQEFLQYLSNSVVRKSSICLLIKGKPHTRKDELAQNIAFLKMNELKKQHKVDTQIFAGFRVEEFLNISRMINNLNPIILIKYSMYATELRRHSDFFTNLLNIRRSFKNILDYYVTSAVELEFPRQFIDLTLTTFGYDSEQKKFRFLLASDSVPYGYVILEDIVPTAFRVKYRLEKEEYLNTLIQMSEK